MPDTKRVIPLESNPDIFNALAQQLGLSPVLSFQDVYSITDPDLVAFLPQPVMALIMLFPITESYEAYRKQQDETTSNDSDGAIWFKQTIGNGCGLYALLHILANLPRDFIVTNLMLNKNLLLQLSPDMLVEEVSKLVELLEQNIQLDSNYGSQGQTEAPAAADNTEYHFITYVRGADGHLYELDGRRTGPVDLGPSSDPHILNDSKLVEKIQFYMDNTDESQRNNFALMAVAPSL
ncbi:CIC11C00000005370 [Sungouiella intermedia]|uniref:Ubiquitin carboxyl-terminal hydrolase n=1 Tax=Sungouiella intermedia TaxID=45354 RepID=A0A1L0B6C6_9ASCO|nr:CIC11C00000005370 [[Candida] intermedia]